MSRIDYITVQDLYAYAKENHLLNARIRICDGMAVSYYPDPNAVSKARYEVVIDVSANEPIGYDELDEYAQNWHRISDQHMNQLDVEAQTMSANARRKITLNTKPSDLPLSIYGYGAKKSRR